MDSVGAAVDAVQTPEAAALAPPTVEAPAVDSADAPRFIVEFIVGLLLAVLTARCFFVEAYVVPSASMAPTLYGNHKSIACDRCGRSFAVGVDDQGRCSVSTCTCPHCGQPNQSLDSAPVLSGDRLLVFKGLFDYRRPYRWEPVVFRLPNDPKQAYVKRTIGLPGESVQVIDGDVYINGVIERKPFGTLLEIVQPILNQDLLGSDELAGRRWGITSAAKGWSVKDAGLAFAGGPKATIGFRQPDGDGETYVSDAVPYNLGDGDFLDRSPVRDLVFRAQLQANKAEGVLELRYLATPEHEYIVRFDFAAGEVVLSNETKELRRAKFSMRESQTEVTLAYWDRRIGLRLDGVAPFEDFDDDGARMSWPHDLPTTRPIELRATGGEFTLRHVRIDRDVYYTDRVRGVHRPRAIDEPVQLGADEFFVLGDNSPISKDSRLWDDPAVPARLIVGKPLFIHLPSRLWRDPWFGRAYQTPDWTRMGFVR